MADLQQCRLILFQDVFSVKLTHPASSKSSIQHFVKLQGSAIRVSSGLRPWEEGLVGVESSRASLTVVQSCWPERGERQWESMGGTRGQFGQTEDPDAAMAAMFL